MNSRRADAASILGRAQAAARRAVEIDAANADGAIVIALGNGLWYSSYADYDRQTQGTLARFPSHAVARRSRSAFLFEVGRVRESVDVAAPLVDPLLPSPFVASQAIKLWSAERPDEAEALLDTLIERWPRHYSIWATRYNFLLFSGKTDKAKAMLDAVPVGLDQIDFVILAAQTRAIEGNDPRDIDAALRLFQVAAAKTISKAQEAAIFASSVGRLDDAFSYLDLALFSAEWLATFRRRFPANLLTPHSGVTTFFLFEPPMRAVRGDPRFKALVARLGIADYWRTGTAPDFRA